MVITASELFSIPLDTSKARIEELFQEARERLKTGETELLTARRDEARIAAAMAVSEGHTDQEQRERVLSLLNDLHYGVDTNTGLSKLAAHYLAFGIMKPLAPMKDDRPMVPMLVLRRIVAALGLTEVVTAMFAIMYLTMDAELRGTFAWRQLNPSVVPHEE